MSNAEMQGLVKGIPGPSFFDLLIGDYTKNLDRFFDEKTGAVREGTRDDGRPPFLYSEVTGYAIRDLLLLHSITGNATYLRKAIKASDWLICAASNEEGWIRTRYYFDQDKDDAQGLDSFAGGNIFSFDNGICLGGLVALYEVIRSEAAREPELKEKVQVLARKISALAGNIIGCLGEDGSVPAIWNAQGKEVRFENPRWSQQRGSFHTKIAESLAELYAATSEGAYADAARRICRFALSHQQEDGRFITDSLGNTQLHPHCYSAEGLHRVGTILKEEEFIASACRATEWALRQCRDGAIAQEIGPSIPRSRHTRTDALAQVLRLGARMLQSAALPDRYWPKVRGLAESVWEMKDPVESHFRYGFYEDGKRSNTLSYWTNMFAFHSLLEYAAAWVCRDTSVIVLAGGIGSRCWPISCVSLPKPLSRGLLGERSLLEETVSRFLKTGCVRPQNVFVVSTASSLDKAQDQMRALGIPPENTIEEPKPKGTLGAVNYALTQVGKRLKRTVAISTADNLIEPLSAFRHAFAKAALAAWWDESSMLISLGVPNREPDSRFGHAIYRMGEEIIPEVYSVNRFVEKPKEADSLRMKEGERFAWDSGCIVSQRGYVTRILEQLSAGERSADPKNLEGDITRQILENDDYRKAVVLYAPTIRFVDVGAPGKDLRQFFIGTKADRGDGNIFLGSESAKVVFLEAHGNIVISDKTSVDIIGINDHLVIDNSHTNSAVVLPLDRVDTLPIIYRMLEGVAGFHPYIVGGEATRNASPHNLAHDCQGLCNTKSTHGLALAIYCTDMRVQRNAERLLVVEQSRFTEEEILTEKTQKAEVEPLTDLSWPMLDYQGLQGSNYSASK